MELVKDPNETPLHLVLSRCWCLARLLHHPSDVFFCRYNPELFLFQLLAVLHHPIKHDLRLVYSVSLVAIFSASPHELCIL